MARSPWRACPVQRDAGGSGEYARLRSLADCRAEDAFFRRAPITSSAPGSGGAVIRGGRDHINLGFMISIPGQPDATPSSLAIWLATRADWPANCLCTGFVGRWQAYFRRQLLANATIAASRVAS